MSTAPAAKPPVAYPGPLSPPHGPWPRLTVWGRWWPGTARPAGAAATASIGAAALVAALSLPLDRAGIGWLVTAVGGTAALIVAHMIPDRPIPGAPPALIVPPPVRLDWDRYCWGTATVALLAVGAFRSAGWLFALCLLVATLTGALAVTGGKSMRAIVAGYALGPAAVVRAVPWLSRGLARIRRPGGQGSALRLVASVLVSIALLTIFGRLFASADGRFADLLSSLTPTIGAGTVVRWIFVFGATAAVLGGAGYLRTAPADLSRLDRTEGRKVNRLEWALPLGLLVLLFAGFVAVQLTVLFGGNRHVLDTEGLTYAGYARGGFWQLCIVTGLTLAVLAGAARWAPRVRTADRVLLRAILGTLAGLTLVVVASALLRVWVYTGAYGLTRLRLLVACCEGWFGLVLVMVLVAGVWIRAPWLPRAALAAGVLALLGLAVANPDGLIAEHNIRTDRTVDLTYLGTLSPDAVPALSRITDDTVRACVLHRIGDGLEPDDWRGWNLGRVLARRVLAGQPQPSANACRWPPSTVD